MKFDDLVAVSGLPGLYRMAANRANGLIVEELATGKRRFASSRKHNFTPLGSIGVFTNDGESVPLKEVFRSMLEQLEDHPPVAPESDSQELFRYFSEVLPEYDPDRVYAGDVKKILRWFAYLQNHGVLEHMEEEE